MENRDKYVIMSLELNLFFARIMKEHSLFLEAAFTPANINLSKEADCYKKQFENLLMNTVELSDYMVSPKILNSGEIITEFTLVAEQQTQKFTGIDINKKITQLESKLQGSTLIRINNCIFSRVKNINIRALKLLNGLISFKEKILSNVLSCEMFTMNYPLLIKHIIREAKLYRDYLTRLESGKGINSEKMKYIEQFWNQIMMEHALFIRGLLDPSEEELIETSNNFAKDYAHLLEKSREANDKTIANITPETIQKTISFRDFKRAGTQGIQDCKIQSIILPLLADHVLREANHYIRLLEN